MVNKLFLNVLVLNLIVLASCTTIEKQQRTVYETNIKADNAIKLQQADPVSVLRVATLNLAHGRKDSFNQIFVGKESHKKNLDDITKVLIKYKPHVVALQEADAPSRWSGSFDHVAYLASGAQYPWRVHASNAQSWLFSYGTAVLSGLPLIESIKHTFEPSPPTLEKGFVLAQIEWPYADENKSRQVDVISVHLDFSRESVREIQVNEMLRILSVRKNPTIILGDFNSEWLADVSGIKALVKKARFVTYEPEGNNHNSYKNKRLDWILISKDMEFVSYQVLSDTLSDHRMIVSDIRFKGGKNK